MHHYYTTPHRPCACQRVPHIPIGRTPSASRIKAAIVDARGLIPDTPPLVDSPVRPGPRLVVWLRCRACQRGYFATGAPGPQPCPACTGGRLEPVALWDLRQEPAPPGMFRLVIDALCGEVGA